KIAAFGADDTRRDAPLEAEGRADSDSPFAHLHAVRIADGGVLQLVAGFDMNYGEVALAVRTDEFRLVLLGIVEEFYLDAVGAIDDVVIGNDIAVGVDDHAGTHLVAALAGNYVAEEAAHHVVFVLGLIAAAGAPASGLADGARDGDHGGFQLFGEGGKGVR